MSSTRFFPSVKPSAIALGTIFTHGSSFLVSAPIFGAAFQKAKESTTRDEFVRSREAASALASYGSSFVGSAFQSYAVAALLNLTGTITYKGAAYLGTLVFAISTAPTVIHGIILEKRPLEVIASQIVSSLLETVGLALTLNWWGTRTQSLLL